MIAQNNPPLPASCGINVILVLDESGSIVGVGGGGAVDILGQVRTGAIALWDALQGTGSTLSLVEFNATARTPPFASAGIPITLANRDSFLAYINGTAAPPNQNRYNPSDSTGFAQTTNWEAAFIAANALNTTLGGADLVLFFTDGVPTTNNNIPGTNDPEGNYDTAAAAQHLHLAPAGVNASLIKQAGTRVLGIGINNSNLPANNPVLTLPYISGPTQFDVGLGNIATADYTLTTGGAFANALRSIVLELCQSSVTVTKQTWNNTTGLWQDAPNWTYSATASPVGDDFLWEEPSPPAPSMNATISGSTAANGTLLFQWKPANPLNPTNITLQETLQDGYEFVNVACLDQATQTIAVTPTLSGDFVNLTSFSVANNAFATCTFRNTQALLAITKTAPKNTYAPGDQFIYTITYSNVATADGFSSVAYDPVITDELDADLKFIEDPSGFCSVSGADPETGFGGTVTCTGMDDLAEGVPAQVSFKVEVQNTNPAVTIVTNTACVDADDSRGNPLEQECDDFDITTPVTVAYFSATATDGGTRFDWSTATETANAGFNLYVETGSGLEPVNDQVILSAVIDSQGLQDYSYDAPGVSGEAFYIEDVGLFGENRVHGPFTLGEEYGERQTPEPIDWTAVAAEGEALAAQRAESAAVARSERSADAAQAVELRVRQDGIYRLTYEQIKAATGVDFNGTPRASLALTNRGEPVSIYVSMARFGPGAYIEFIGEGLDTLYTDTNVYRLEVNPDLAQRAGIQRARPTNSMIRRPGVLPQYYMETATVETNNLYSTLSAGGDPWYIASLVAQNPNTKWTYSLNVDNYVAGAAPAIFNLTAWGMSNLVDGPDHHLLGAINNTQVFDRLYDGNELVDVSAQLPAGVLKEGANQLVLTKPLDRGAALDYTGLESYGVVYPRAFVARDGRLTFEGQATAFGVTNLPSQDVVVYRQEADGRLVKITGLVFAAGDNGTWRVFFRGTRADATYYVSTVSSLPVAQATAAHTSGNLTTGQAELLVISHPNFIAGLAPWLQARQADYSIKVVDVRDVYGAYSGGVFDADAIAQYVRYAVQNMGTEFVVLVGGDTYDYRNYSGGGSISFIPSLYAHTVNYINFAPVDPLYTDVNGDNVPDAAIGRFPVRTVAELQLMVQKILQYDARSNVQTAVFASDNGFERDSDAFATPLGGWAVQKAYPGMIGNTSARNALISALNQGPRLTSFVGHSASNGWTFTGLFLATDAAKMTNYNAPTLVTQWGCWNTYYVDPKYDTLGHMFLLSSSTQGTIGAAVVTGSTTLTKNTSERALGDLMMSKLMTPGTPVGAAMQAAKAELALTRPGFTDVLLGWTILGDPTVVVRP